MVASAVDIVKKIVSVKFYRYVVLLRLSRMDVGECRNYLEPKKELLGIPAERCAFASLRFP
jgi:hypothetical protein